MNLIEATPLAFIDAIASTALPPVANIGSTMITTRWQCLMVICNNILLEVSSPSLQSPYDQL